MLDSTRHLWAVVLAGGEGDSQTLLRHTLDRVARLIPPSQTIAVTQASHAAHVAGELAGHPAITVLAQPCDRGTAAGVLLAAHWIRARAPGAVVVGFPTNHFILEESVFISHVAAAGRTSEQSRVAPAAGRAQTTRRPLTAMERGGWSGTGAVGDGPSAVHRSRVYEKPPRSSRAAARARHVQHTVFHGTVTALVDAGLACLPLLHDRLTRFDLFTGTRYETVALQQAYLFAPTADFSRAVLASSDVPLAVAEISALTWWDLGSPERVARSVGVGDPRE